MQERLQFYIDGRWVDPAEARPFDVINPATEEPIARIALGSAKDVDLAVAAARRAFETFSQTTREQRIDAAQVDRRRLSGALRRDRRDDLARDGRAALARRRRRRPRRASATSTQMIEVLEELRVRGAARHDADPARADRRVRPDHAVELADQPDRVQGGARARGGLHDGAQADRDRAAQRDPVRRDPARRRACRRACSTS